MSSWAAPIASVAEMKKASAESQRGTLNVPSVNVHWKRILLRWTNAARVKAIRLEIRNVFCFMMSFLVEVLFKGSFLQDFFGFSQ